MFYNEKNTGRIRVVEYGSPVEKPFAELTVMAQGEAGLLGLALHPNFDSNHYLYVYFSYRNASGYGHVAIRRFTAEGNVGTYPVNIFDLTNPTGSAFHNGGYIKFGPDGKLYVQVGEFQNRPLSQNLNSYAGKILRLNPDGSVPSDNPFPNSLVYAYGIRNGFGMDFDPNTGRLIATEAGPDRDEVNIIAAGGNYGWPTCLGVCNDPRYVDPILTIGPPATTPTGIVQVGTNTAFFGEWGAADIKMMRLTPAGTVEEVEQAFRIRGDGVIALERGLDGNIYFSTSDAVYRFPGPRQVTYTVSTKSIYTSAISQSSSQFDSRSTPPSDRNRPISPGVASLTVGLAFSAIALVILLRFRRR